MEKFSCDMMQAEDAVMQVHDILRIDVPKTIAMLDVDDEV